MESYIFKFRLEMGRSVVEHLLKMYAGSPGPISDISSYKELVANYVKGLRQLECQNQSEWTKSRNMGEGVWVQFMKGEKMILNPFFCAEHSAGSISFWQRALQIFHSRNSVRLKKRGLLNIAVYCELTLLSLRPPLRLSLPDWCVTVPCLFRTVTRSL